MISSLVGYHAVEVIKQRDMHPFIQTVSDEKGFPGFKNDAEIRRLDLSMALIRHPSNTFFVEASETAMRNSGIEPGKIVLVEKGKEPKNGDIILAYFEGEFIFRKIYIKNLYPQLIADQDEDERIEVEPDHVFAIWGVVIDIL